MRLGILCPAPPGTLHGNRITAMRWAQILRELGHRVSVQTQYDGADFEILIALHARRSARAVFEFHDRYPSKPVIVALTGTDLYHDIHHYERTQYVLEIACRLVVLQPLAREELALALRNKARVIYQSVERTSGAGRRPDGFFQVCVAGHLRNVKDPFRAAMAVRRLPATSRIQVVHAGAAMTDHLAQRARAEEGRNPRYRWLGELPRSKARRLIASSQLMVLTSRREGGANVISEAIVDGTPVIASRIPGSVGLLGAGYPGLYPFGDTEALRSLLLRAEHDHGFYNELRSRCGGLAKIFNPAHERARWRSLLDELG